MICEAMANANLIGSKEKHKKNVEDVSSLMSSLRGCAKRKDLYNGEKLHEEIVKKGLLEKEACIGSSLMHMYAKCGELTKAQEVFDILRVRDVICWTTLIGGYAQYGYNKEALKLYEKMCCHGPAPDGYTFVCILKVCGSIKSAKKGREIHADIVERGFSGKDMFVSNALVDMYSKCGALNKAVDVFDELRVRDVVSWTSLIGGYTQYGYGQKGIECFTRMQQEGLHPNSITLICILKSCGSIREPKKGQQIHSVITKVEDLNKHFLIGNALLDMYAKCGLLEEAQDLFDELPARDIVSWNALISGYAQYGKGVKALSYLEWMICEGFSPDSVTFVCILKACGTIHCLKTGQFIHEKILKEGLLEKETWVGNALIDMYVKCGDIRKAEKVFNEIPNRDIISWTSLISGYSEYGYGEEALNYYRRMQDHGFLADGFIFSCILKACGSIGATEKGQKLHDEIVNTGWLKKDILIGNALVDMYAKCGALRKAQEVFNEIQLRDVVSWNVLIAGYTQHGNGEEALTCLEDMKSNGFGPDAVTFLCILKACGMLGAIEKGESIHNDIVRDGWLERHSLIGNALVDMYAKCGAIAKAQVVFDELPIQALVSWNSLIAGYAQVGKNELAFDTFNEMIRQGIVPDLITCTILLTTCSHSGLLEKGQMYFASMSTCFGIRPTVEHHTCVIDLFGRAGHFEKVQTLVDEMPYSENHTTWLTVLGACHKWTNVKLGKLALDHSIQLDENEAAAYVLMRNIYTAAGRREDADKVKAMGVEKKAWEERYDSEDGSVEATGMLLLG